MYVIEHRAECQDCQTHHTDCNADYSEEYQQVFQAVKYPKALETSYERMPCFHD